LAKQVIGPRRELVIGNWVIGTKRQQSTDNSQQTTVNRQQSTVNRQQMTEVTAISAQAAALLVHYGFDLGGKKAEKLAGEWLTKYPGYWLRLAVVEALYQGRYKAVSVGQLLSMWHRIGEPLYHFNREFERLVCNNFPQNLTLKSDDRVPQEDILLSNPESQVGVAELDLLCAVRGATRSGASCRSPEHRGRGNRKIARSRRSHKRKYRSCSL
jgi:hypothetical protein